MHPIILILGPTAGGKTALSIELARRLPGECVACDSMQVYRGMDIGTAKPTPPERAAAPHHLLDLIEPADDSFSVDRWLELAEAAVAGIRSRNLFPIVVGGTNLYVQALLQGMLEGPEPDLALRERLNVMDIRELRARLERSDPAAAAQIHPNDRKRSVRAIEVFEQTGRRLSDLQTQWENRPPRADVRIIGLDWPVEAINPRINARVKAMMESGFLDEVRQLKDADALGRNAREALGYKQLLEHLEGRSSLEEAVEQIKIRTRRYAKQQRTWLRRFRAHPGSVWLDAASLSEPELAARALEAARRAG